MICPNCNYTIYEETRFCPKCGTDLAQYNMFANIDKGANMATASMICGILSLFTGPLFAILSLIFASKYKKIGNGENAKNVKVGKVCSWISLGVIFAVVALVFAISGFIFLSDSDSIEIEGTSNISGYIEEVDDYPDTEEEPLTIDTSALFINIENRYYTEADETMNDEQNKLIIYSIYTGKGYDVEGKEYNTNMQPAGKCSDCNRVKGIGENLYQDYCTLS